MDKRDRNHEVCLRTFDGIVEEITTTEAVITEACYLLQRRTGNAVAALVMLLESDVETVSPDTPYAERIIALMDKYSDAPMDYADATLVAAAERIGTRRIFTLDRRHFLTYRLYDRESFQIVP